MERVVYNTHRATHSDELDLQINVNKFEIRRRSPIEQPVICARFLRMFSSCIQDRKDYVDMLGSANGDFLLMT